MFKRSYQIYIYAFLIWPICVLFYLVDPFSHLLLDGSIIINSINDRNSAVACDCPIAYSKVSLALFGVSISSLLGFGLPLFNNHKSEVREEAITIRVYGELLSFVLLVNQGIYLLRPPLLCDPIGNNNFTCDSFQDNKFVLPSLSWIELGLSFLLMIYTTLSFDPYKNEMSEDDPIILKYTLISIILQYLSSRIISIFSFFQVKDLKLSIQVNNGFTIDSYKISTILAILFGFFGILLLSYAIHLLLYQANQTLFIANVDAQMKVSRSDGLRSTLRDISAVNLAKLKYRSCYILSISLIILICIAQYDTTIEVLYMILPGAITSIFKIYINPLIDKPFIFALYSCYLVLLRQLLVTYQVEFLIRTLNPNKRDLMAEQEANESRREFLRFVFHEVRIPLASISMGINLFNIKGNGRSNIAHIDNNPLLNNQLNVNDDEDDIPEECADTIAMMADATDFMTQTLNDVFSVQKIEDGKLELTFEESDILGIIRRATTSMKGQIYGSNMTLNIRIAPDVPLTVICDRIRLEHVLANFISNAVKFSKEGDQIELSCSMLHKSYLLQKHPDLRPKIDNNNDESSNTFVDSIYSYGKSIFQSWGLLAKDEPTIPKKFGSSTSVASTSSATSSIYPGSHASISTHNSLAHHQQTKNNQYMRAEGNESARKMSKKYKVIHFSVLDKGIGVKKEDQERLFDVYTQIRPGELQGGRGTGMGLAICREIIALHHGLIGVNSEPSKKPGSEFFFSVPVKVTKGPSNEMIEFKYSKDDDRAIQALKAKEASNAAKAEDVSLQYKNHILAVNEAIVESSNRNGNGNNNNNKINNNQPIKESSTGDKSFRNQRMGIVNSPGSSDDESMNDSHSAPGGALDLSDAPEYLPNQIIAHTEEPLKSGDHFDDSEEKSRNDRSRSGSVITMVINGANSPLSPLVPLSGPNLNEANFKNAALLKKATSKAGAVTINGNPNAGVLSKPAPLLNKSEGFPSRTFSGNNLATDFGGQDNIKKNVNKNNYDDDLHILVVDDGAANCKLLAMLLNSHQGVRAYEASCGTECFASLEKIREKIDKDFDLIIMDNIMPDYTGLQCTHTLREKLGYSNLLLGLTGNVMNEDLQRFIDVGADIALAKPLRLETVGELLNHCRTYGTQGIYRDRIDMMKGKPANMKIKNLRNISEGDW
jgi:signal transduction histidine kinase/CheY-like chemotaxis protein